MANKKISELPSGSTPLSGSELMEGVQGGVNVKFTSQDVANLAPSGAVVATQSEVNSGSDNTKTVTPLTLKNRDGDVATLSDSATTDITSDKWTWASSAATRTMTFSFTGDKSEGVLTLSATALVITFPAACLCVSDGLASGDNTATLAGVSGDKYYVSIRKIASTYWVIVKNFGQ